MRNRKKNIILTLAIALSFSICFPEYVEAQTVQNNEMEVILCRDTIKKVSFFKKIYNYFASSNKQSGKKFDISVIGGPHYSDDVKLGLGIVAAGLYKTTTNAPLSNVSLYADVTTSGFYLLGIKGNNIFENEKFRVTYSLSFYSFPSYIWGFGYNSGNNNDSKSKYLKISAQARSSILFKIVDNLYLGPAVGYNFIEGSKFTDTVTYSRLKHISRGINMGGEVIYDSRDFIPNPSTGFYFKFTQNNYLYFNSKPYFRSAITADYYIKAWKNAIIAFDMYSEFNYGNTPWTMLAALGGSNRMRGYYDGRYRDNNMIEIQTELRQKIYNRHGIAVWTGAGNVFGDYGAFNWKHTLPNYGIGYRWEFKKRVNIRFDYGFGKKGQSSFIFSIEEAF